MAFKSISMGAVKNKVCLNNNGKQNGRAYVKDSKKKKLSVHSYFKQVKNCSRKGFGVKGKVFFFLKFGCGAPG